MKRAPFVVIGLAGGIGAGKSTVASAFERLGLVVSRSDAEAHALLGRPEVAEKIASRFGEGVRSAGGIDRAALARIVFADAAARRWLEGLIHPMLKVQRKAARQAAVGAGAAGMVIDAPLLFEAGVDKECDAVVWVEAPEADRLRRVGGRGWDAAELARREAAQMPLDDKRARCGYTVVNADGRTDIDTQVRSVLDQVVKQVQASIGH